MIWSTNKLNLKHRRYIHHVALEVLESEGRPMQNKELKERVESIRGKSSNNFQIHVNTSNPEVIRIEPKLWGLKRRDLDLSLEEEMYFIKRIEEEFKLGKQHLSCEEVAKIMESLGLSKKVTLYQIISVLRGYIPIGKNHKYVFDLKIRKGRNQEDKFDLISA